MRLQPDRLLTRRVDPLVMKSLNAIELLELIRTHGPISRADLAGRSRLSKPTVSDQVDSLLSRGFVVEIGQGSAGSRGGKKPTMLQFNGNLGQILAADIGPEWMRFALADLHGSVIRRLVLPTRPEKGARCVVRTLKMGLGQLMNGSPAGDIQVISLAVPGIIDVQRGLVMETDNVFGWRDLNLASDIAAHFGIPVHIDNDVNMAALAELNAGGAPDNFVFVRLHYGIGAAVVLGGRLHHGAHWAAGEIGHMLLDIGGLGQKADPRGHLESVVGQDRVQERIHKLSRRGGKPHAEQQVSRQVALHLGSAITNIAALYDPQAVILHGEAFGPLLDEIQAIVRRYLPWPVELRLSQQQEDAPLGGALAAGLTHAYGQISYALQKESAGPSSLVAGL